MKHKTKWLAFNIAMPDELIPIYDFLQNELNFFLSDGKCRTLIETINLNQHKGNVWLEMRDLFEPRIATWQLHNKTWHSYILFENLRREIQAKYEAITIWDELVNNNMEINQLLFDNLVSNHKVYATRGMVSNIKRSGVKPELPYKATFQLDYTVSEKQFFRMSENNMCKIKISKTDWIDYQIILPSSLNHNLTGVIAKPRFMKRNCDGKYIGLCSYEYIPEKTIGNKILGVDIGQIKLFSAIALDKDGSYSDEYINSKITHNKNLKLKRLYDEKSCLYDIIKQNEILEVDTYKNNNRKLHFKGISNKIMKLKKDIARNVANEIVYIANKEGCNVIHIENLTWMSSKGGKWNHAETHKYIEEKAITMGIKVVKVNPAYSSSQHPITKEIGNKQARLIKFSNDETIDRDILAAINLAVRNKGKKKENKITKVRSKHKSRRTRITKSRKKNIREKLGIIKGDTKIVVFSPYVPKDEKLSIGVWSRINRVQPSSSLLGIHKFSVCIN